MTGPRIEPNVGSAGLCISVLSAAIATATGPVHTLIISGHTSSPSLPPDSPISHMPIFLPSCHQTALCNKQILPSHSLFPGLKTLDGNLQDKIRTQPVSPGPSGA